MRTFKTKAAAKGQATREFKMTGRECEVIGETATGFSIQPIVKPLGGAIQIGSMAGMK